MNQINAHSDLLPQTYACRVESIEALTQDIHRVRLVPQAASALVYLAGQYLELILPEGRGVPFSIASAPHQEALELNIMHVPASDTSNAVMAHLTSALISAESVSVRLPMGDCVLDAGSLKSDSRLLFIAASTGFAQIKSMVEHALEAGISSPIGIYWGVRSPEHFYDLELPQRWVERYPNVRFVPVVSDPSPAADWPGASGLVHEHALREVEDFSAVRIYVSGSPAMVYAVEDAFKARGMGEGQMFSDVFSYAPRT